MDLELTETQKLLRNTARSWLETECPWKVVSDIQASTSGYSPEMWHQMAELGWTAVRVRDLTRGAYREQVRGYVRQSQNLMPVHHY